MEFSEMIKSAMDYIVDDVARTPVVIDRSEEFIASAFAIALAFERVDAPKEERIMLVQATLESAFYHGYQAGIESTKADLSLWEGV